MIGSPMVFHTAPPQPASNARMICSPQFVGGADASQNGLGQRMPPAKVVERSGLGSSGMHHLEGHGGAGALPIGHRIHNLAAPVDTIAACEIFRMTGASTDPID